MTQQKIKELKQSLNSEFKLIHELCLYVLSASQRQDLIRSTLSALHAYLSWIPLGYIFESPLLETLLKFFHVPAYRNLTLQCLTELVAALNFGDFYNVQYVKMYTIFIGQLQTILPPSTNIPEAYLSGSGEEQAFIQNLALFFTSFFKFHIRVLESAPDTVALLLAGLEYLINISYVDDTEVFKVCLDYWNTLVLELFDAHHNSDNPAASINLMGLQMLRKLTKQLSGEEWAWNTLNTLCWAIGSISGSMAEDQENRFLVMVIRDLLNLCEITKGKDNKAVIASNIMYVVGQYPRFLRAHWKFLKTVVNKLFEFMHETHPGVQDMACDTFLKIVQKCKRKFVIVQVGEREPFVSELLSGLASTVQDLEPYQIHSFYESKWAEIIGQARHSVEVLKDPVVIRTVLNILQRMDSDSEDVDGVGCGGAGGGIGAGGIGAGGNRGKKGLNPYKHVAADIRKERLPPQDDLPPPPLRGFADGSQLLFDWRQTHPALLCHIICQIRDICWALVLGGILQFVYNKDRGDTNLYKELDVEGFADKVKLGNKRFEPMKKVGASSMSVGSLKNAMAHVRLEGIEKKKDTEKKKPKTYTVKGYFRPVKGATPETITRLLETKGPIGFTLDFITPLADLRDGSQANRWNQEARSHDRGACINFRARNIL
ncbi:hypothetical protein F2Q69_00000707 [Brassica cretica]|uniref:Exportin-1/Importin-beta-like domain-containing protein n=1 Tax=Brassica cretica TaxID=69181 RepID=A0A8S9P202_BRACR|nr:hypothetical protein F2Q69_00000707 [Brassica cretica]